MEPTNQKTYTNTGGPKGLPGLGMLIPAKRNPLNMLMENSRLYGDIIPFHIAGLKMLQINHPEIIRYVSVENHKNYYKSDIYIRFQPAVGEGLLTSNGEKWRRNRQTIQPVFKREQIEGYYFDVVNDISEKFKRRWLTLTEKGAAELDITSEMSSLTIEIVLKTIFGRNNLSPDTIKALHYSYHVLMEYLKDVRVLPRVDFEQIFHTPHHSRFKKELAYVEKILTDLMEQYRKGELDDKNNMLALLIEAQKQDPENFSDKDIRDQSVGMVFAGFETTSIVLQWMWYALDARPDIAQKLRENVAAHAPCTLTRDSLEITYDAIMRMDYLSAVFKETMRLYPPLWATSKQPVEDDAWGDFKVRRGTVVVVPQMAMHRHPRYWEEPNAFIPERFFPENEVNITPGSYFPFALGPRGCIGQRFAEMEAKVIFAKLMPLFKVTALNIVDNGFDPSISLRLIRPLQAKIQRV